MFGADASARQEIAYVSEGVLYPAWARVGDVIDFERNCRARFDGQRLDAWLVSQRIERGKKTSALSKGEAKRLELEIAFGAQPRVFLLDEPFSGFDPRLAETRSAARDRARNVSFWLALAPSLFGVAMYVRLFVNMSAERNERSHSDGPLVDCNNHL